MAAVKSVGAMLKQCAGLVGTADISAWEHSFLVSVLSQSNDGEDTTKLSERQLNSIESIYKRHFA